MQAYNDSTRDTLLFMIDSVLSIIQHLHSSPEIRGRARFCKARISLGCVWHVMCDTLHVWAAVFDCLL